MIDLETLGTRPTSIVISIGACFFDIDSGEIGPKFYLVLNLDQQKAKGRTTDEDTLAWWTRQSPEAKAVFDSKQIDCLRALKLFDAFVRQNTHVAPWGNGASFDVAIMEDLFRTFELKIPWQYWNTMDLRTYRRFIGGNEKLEKGGVNHNAIDDAVSQAEYVMKHAPKKEFRNVPS